ncbi:MAG: glycosyltransferase family 2 protein [Candidatus Promineifilaceae bacterium]
MNYPPILTIILNWQQPEITIEAVQALQASTYPSINILVIDNGSRDNSAAILKATLPDVTVISLPENRGFASGCNWGLKWAREHGYSWAFLLNNDAFVTPTTLQNLMETAEPDVALLSPKIFYEQKPQYIWFAGGNQHPKLLEMRNSGEGELDAPKWQQTRDVDYLVGTGLLVNLAAVFHAGLLDEQFFMYYEDLDWSIRLRESGYKLRLVANAHLYHRVSFSSGGTETPPKLYHQAKSSVIFFRRHAHKGSPYLILLYRTGSALKRLLLLLIKDKIKSTSAYLRGLIDGWHIANKKKG